MSLDMTNDIFGVTCVPRMCAFFSMEPFTLGDLSLDISDNMCPYVKVSGSHQ